MLDILEIDQRVEWLRDALASDKLTTPCLVIDCQAIEAILALFRKHLQPVSLYYSVKANNDPSVLRYLDSQGLGFDVASVKELQDSLAMGVDPGRVILSHTVKSKDCIDELFRNRVPLTTVDNERDLRVIAAAADGRDHELGILIRIKLEPGDAKINLNGKFGCSKAEAMRLIKLAGELSLRPVGIHFHVGSQCWNVQDYARGVRTAMEVIAEARERFGVKLNQLNIGGGFPDATTAVAVGGLESFFEDLGKAVAPALDSGLSLSAEPGRVLVADACTAVCQVIGKSQHDGREWLYLDDGIYGLFSTAFFEKSQFCIREVVESHGPPMDYVIAGPTCDSLDIVSGSCRLPATVEPGSYVYAHGAGAYSVSVKSHFNGMAQISSAVSERVAVEVAS